MYLDSSLGVYENENENRKIQNETHTSTRIWSSIHQHLECLIEFDNFIENKDSGWLYRLAAG